MSEIENTSENEESLSRMKRFSLRLDQGDFNSQNYIPSSEKIDEELKESSEINPKPVEMISTSNPEFVPQTQSIIEKINQNMNSFTSFWYMLKQKLAKYGAIIIFALIAIAIAIMVIQRNRILGLKNDVKDSKEEASRIQNNYDASQDTIKVYRDKAGNLVSSISAYKITIKELNSKYSNLFNLYTKEKNKPPIYIVEYKTKIDEKISNISTMVDDTSITFIDSVKFSDGNYRNISGNIPYNVTYHIKKDMVNQYAFEKALYFAYVLEENGVPDSKIIAFKDGKKIPIKEALKDNNSGDILFKVEILKSSTQFSLKQISDKYKIDEKLLALEYENGQFIYYVGNIIPFKNINPIIEKEDLNTYAKINTGKATINYQQGMEIYTGLYKDKKTGRPMIEIKSNYPGLKFTNIVGADIMQDPTSRKVAREFRKEFGFGLSMGYGAAFVDNLIKSGFVINAGINWSPRFLQFGPSKK